MSIPMGDMINDLSFKNQIDLQMKYKNCIDKLWVLWLNYVLVKA